MHSSTIEALATFVVSIVVFVGVLQLSHRSPRR
jgi:hypothetical protein